MKLSKHGWLIPGLGLCCYVTHEGSEIYGVFTPGGKFIRHLTKDEAYERHFGDLPAQQKFNNKTRIDVSYAHKIPVPV